MITTSDIIEKFHFNELQQNTHSEEYLNEIATTEYIEDLVDTVALWVRECEGDKCKAMMYVIQTLDAY